MIDPIVHLSVHDEAAPHGRLLCGLPIEQQSHISPQPINGPHGVGVAQSYRTPTGKPICHHCRVALQIERAEKVSINDYDGALYCDDVGDNEGYFTDSAELADSLATSIGYGDRDADSTPTHAWPCDRTLLRLDADWIIEHAIEDLWEGAYDAIKPAGIAALQIALDAWRDEHAKIYTLEEIRPRTKVIVLDGAWRDSLQQTSGED